MYVIWTYELIFAHSQRITLLPRKLFTYTQNFFNSYLTFLHTAITACLACYLLFTTFIVLNTLQKLIISTEMWYHCYNTTTLSWHTEITNLIISTFLARLFLATAKQMNSVHIRKVSALIHLPGSLAYTQTCSVWPNSRSPRRSEGFVWSSYFDAFWSNHWSFHGESLLTWKHISFTVPPPFPKSINTKKYIKSTSCYNMLVASSKAKL